MLLAKCFAVRDGELLSSHSMVPCVVGNKLATNDCWSANIRDQIVRKLIIKKTVKNCRQWQRRILPNLLTMRCNQIINETKSLQYTQIRWVTYWENSERPKSSQGQRRTGSWKIFLLKFRDTVHLRDANTDCNTSKRNQVILHFPYLAIVGNYLYVLLYSDVYQTN